jgi:hypothetical protein
VPAVPGATVTATLDGARLRTLTVTRVDRLPGGELRARFYDATARRGTLYTMDEATRRITTQRDGALEAGRLLEFIAPESAGGVATQGYSCNWWDENYDSGHCNGSGSSGGSSGNSGGSGNTDSGACKVPLSMQMSKDAAAGAVESAKWNYSAALVATGATCNALALSSGPLGWGACASSSLWLMSAITGLNSAQSNYAAVNQSIYEYCKGASAALYVRNRR